MYKKYIRLINNFNKINGFKVENLIFGCMN